MKNALAAISFWLEILSLAATASISFLFVFMISCKSVEVNLGKMVLDAKDVSVSSALAGLYHRN